MFVDINMPDLSGVDFVRGLENPPMVIFTTAYSEYAIEGFKLDAVDYLLKPFSFDDFQRAVGKARSLLELQRLREEQVTSSVDTSAQGTSENNDCISIKADYKVSLVKYADIIYIESVGEYVRLHLTSGSSIMTLLRLKNIESALPSDRFMRVHRSYIVNLGHVTGYARGRVYLDNEEYVPISINYRDQFREYMEKMHPANGL
jgi:two-component system LytT family response regulator